MSVTVSKPNNILSPSGNSLAVFKEAGNTNFTVKDIYGVTQELKLLGKPVTQGSNANLGNQIFTSFSQMFDDATQTPLITFDFSELIKTYKDKIPNVQITGTVYSTQSACANEVDSATSNYLRLAFNLLIQINASGELKTLFSVDEIPASDEPTSQAFDNANLFVFFDFADIQDASGKLTIVPNTFQDISALTFNTVTNVTGGLANFSTRMNNGWVELNLNASSQGNTVNASKIIDLIDISISGNNLTPSATPTTPVNVPLTDATFQSAINQCLAQDPVNGDFDVKPYGTISEWDVSQVEDMSNAFRGETFFNGDITAWDVSAVENMSGMFQNAQAFNQDIGAWDVSAVENMTLMFNNASTFNQDISSWNVASVENMSDMFNEALAFNQSLNSWSVGGVENMSGMFSGATSFNGALSTWSLGQCEDTSFMFANAISFDRSIPLWNVTNVLNMDSMFENTIYNQPMGSWSVSACLSMNNMFKDNPNINQPIGSWLTSSCKSMISMFENCTSFNRDLSAWDVSLVTPEIKRANFDTGATSWVLPKPPFGIIVPTVPLTNATFQTAINDILALDSNGDVFLAPYGKIQDWDVSQVTNMSQAFQTTNFNGDLSSWDTSSVTNMSFMFAETLFVGDITSWDVSSVQDFKYMFQDDTLFNQDIGSWDVSSAIDMEYMFGGASGFQAGGTQSPTNTNLSSWDVSGVLNFSNMFIGANFISLGIGSWDVSSATNMAFMFFGQGSLNEDISSWDVSSVDNMNGMFSSASSFNQNLSGWNVNPNVTQCSNFDNGASSWLLSRPSFTSCTI
jgi:surface protein